jgi:hypothetical protein
MITTLKINNLSDIKGDFITNMLVAMFSNYGEIEIIIKPKSENIKDEIFRRIKDIENGAELLCFNEKEFDEFNKKLLIGIKPDKLSIKKTRKHETNNII